MSNLAASMSAHHEVTVVCTTPPLDTEATVRSKYKLIRLGRAQNFQDKLRIRRVLTTELLRHDKVLINGLENVVCPLAIRLRKKYALKVVGDPVWEHARNLGLTRCHFNDFQHDTMEQKRFAGLIARRNHSLLHAADIVVPSNYMRKIVLGWGVTEPAIHVISNGVQLASCERNEYEIADTDSPLKVIFVGRLTNWKGIETLLLAVQRMAEVQAIIVGDGPEYTHLIELAKQLEITARVRFTGLLSSIEVTRHLLMSDVLVLTSLYEGMSHVMLEAMSLGVPCIASDCCGNPEIVSSGTNGLLIRPQNIDQLIWALEECRDRNYRNRLGFGARSVVSAFSLENAVTEYSLLLSQ